MPIPVTFKCPKCGGETDLPNELCVVCYEKVKYNMKHLSDKSKRNVEKYVNSGYKQ